MASNETRLVCPRCGKYPFKLAPHDCDAIKAPHAVASQSRDRAWSKFDRWAATRLANLEKQRQKAVSKGKYLEAGGVAMRMDELEYVRSQFSAMPDSEKDKA